MIQHPFPPLFDENSRVLILGSFPSVKSREQKFFYGHPQNRFWKVTSAVIGCPVPHRRKERVSPFKQHRPLGRHSFMRYRRQLRQLDKKCIGQ